MSCVEINRSVLSVLVLLFDTTTLKAKSYSAEILVKSILKWIETAAAPAARDIMYRI